VAGSNGHINFSAGALNEIFKHSQGIPRLINLVCDRTLLAGYAKQSNYLDKQMVKKGAESLKKQGVPSTACSKSRRRLLLGCLAVLLGCIFLIGFQNEILHVTLSRFAHFGRPSVATRIGGSESVTTSTHESTSSSGVMEAEEVSHPYSIHISSHRDNRRALMGLNELRKLGYHAFTTKVEIPGKGIWHRVMFGKFRTKGEAQAVLKKVKMPKGFSNPRIIRVKGGEG
jgi:hypothetical protein